MHVPSYQLHVSQLPGQRAASRSPTFHFSVPPQMKFATLDWVPEHNLLLQLLAGWAFSLPLLESGSCHREIQQRQVRVLEEGRGRVRMMGREKGPRTELYFL